MPSEDSIERRMQGLADELADHSDIQATAHDREVALTVVGDEDARNVDLRPVFRAALRYGLVPFDGSAGNQNVVELHFKTREEAFEDVE